MGLQKITLAPPSLVMVSGMTGRVLDSTDATDPAYWRRRSKEKAGFGSCAGTLSDLEVDAVVEIGPNAILGPKMAATRPAPVVLQSLRRPSGSEPAAEGDGCFVEAVAGAYEAGLPVSFSGLFAGEVRRRISLPSYPFQRRRHWFESAAQAASAS